MGDEDQLTERWKTSVPGDGRHAIAVDRGTQSVVIGSGWGVAYAAQAVYRLDLATGEQTARTRTRSQEPRCIAPGGGSTFVATDNRLFELCTASLEVIRQWDKGLVRFPSQMVVPDKVVATASAGASMIAIISRQTGEVKRRKADDRPVMVRLGGEVIVFGSVQLCRWTIDVDKLALAGRTATEQVQSASNGKEFWKLAAGSHRPGLFDAVVSGANASPSARLTAGVSQRCAGLVVAPCAVHSSIDSVRGVLWWLSERGSRLDALSLASGEILHTVTTSGASFAVIDAAAGVVLRVVHGDDPSRNARASRVHCLALPAL
jgi:hypothetical protein